MNQLLFERSTGDLGPNVFARIQATQLLSTFRPAPRFRFDGGERPVAAPWTSIASGSGRRGDGGRDCDEGQEQPVSLWAHQSGVNALALERFDGRILVSGGSDATIKLWDLEQCSNPNSSHTFRPVASVPRAVSVSDSSTSTSTSQQYPGLGPARPGGHRYGVTHLSFYPFDSNAFLSCSYDQTLKLWSTERVTLSGSFNLNAKVYTHAVSPIASHLLVACGTQHPAVRLVDLRSGSAVQSLVSPGLIGGSAGATLSVAWSPVHEHVLASGSVDGAVRIWDVRRSSGLIGLLDKEDSLGILNPGRIAATSAGAGLEGRGIRYSARAHDGPVNGLTWTDDGEYIVSAGHDRRIRVWSAATGANTLASFGPSIRNNHIGSLTMFVSPTGLTTPGRELLFFPNETEILVMDLHEGSIITRLRGMGATMAAVRSQGGGERSIRNRVTSIVWRGAGGGGSSSGVVMGGRNAPGGIYSGHGDGQIRAWLPRVEGLDDEDEDPETKEALEVRTKKRKVLDDAFRSLMGHQITFT